MLPDLTSDMRTGNKATTMMLRSRVQAQHLQGQLAIQVLADCHKRARDLLAKGGLAEPMSAILHRCQLLCVKMALNMLGEKDQGDLYFEQGQEAHNFHESLVRGQCHVMSHVVRPTCLSVCRDVSLVAA